MITETRLNILIVEDEPISAELTKRSLGRLGHQVAGVAENFSDALTLSHTTQPDLVLMDIQLKGDVDGVMTAQRIQRELQIPVVYLTAHTDNNTISRALHSGFYGFVRKPFTDEELKEAIKCAMDRHHVKQQNLNQKNGK
jgi:CheY-like chemotaxis protein